ncbi:MAG: FAD-dependent oxidoreductase, partial [Bdellovibrionota bacterium]
MSETTLILGAGLAGLASARYLTDNYRLFEKQPEVGGVARTFDRQGFLFDVTGHWLHLRDPDVKALIEELLPGALLEVQRRAAIYSHGILTPYPYQANTHGLPTQVVAECVLGYFRAREANLRGDAPPPNNFEAYIRQHMGDGIAEHFMIPYNTKLWGIAPAQMSHTWCGRFVPLPTPEEIVYGALTPGGAGDHLGYNATFLYPKSGGIGRLPRALHASLKRPAECGREVLSVDWKEKEVLFRDGERLPYKWVISTLPLKSLVEDLIDPPEDIRRYGNQLRATSVTYWDIAVPTPNAQNDPHWTYFPQPDVPFYRVGSASAAVPSLAPPGHRTHYVEVSHPMGTAPPASQEDILAGLRRVGVLKAQEVPTVCVSSTIACAYVVMDQNYGPARQAILDWLRTQNILSVGRYG